MLILAASPHAHGKTDQLARAANEACRCSTLLFLRDFNIAPCQGCGFCVNSGHCIFTDDCDQLFKALQEPSALIIIAPIYFYALPAHFKAFIDRSQQFWQSSHHFHEQRKPAGIILAAGRTRGNSLFRGSLLTLRWFLKPFSYYIAHKLLCRGSDNQNGFLETNMPLAISMAKILCNQNAEGH